MGDKGIYIAELSDQPHVEFVKLGLPGFYEIKLHSENDVAAALPAAPTDDYFRLVLIGANSADKKSLESDYTYLPHLEVLDRRITIEDPMKLIREDSFRGVYFKNLFEQIENSPEMESAIRLAAEISQKIMTGLEVDLP